MFVVSKKQNMANRILMVIGICVALHSASPYQPHVAPFFFMCNYHGNVNELGIENGEVALSVSIGGNPELYVPGQFYNVTITSSLNFDGFFLTGLYTLTTEAKDRLQNLGVFGNHLSGQNLMCSIVHSHISREPQQQLSFVWVAPSAGTGCVSFLATGTLGQQLLFKDTTVLQICEQGAATTSPLRPDLAVVHRDGVILRDDFDSSPDFDLEIWLNTEGVNISRECGTVMYGYSAWFSQRHGTRKLTTSPLNTTSAVILQFAVSSGLCGSQESHDNNITISYGLNGCTDWTEIDSVRVPPSPQTDVHLIHLPSRSRGDHVCIQWQQLSTNQKLITTTKAWSQSHWGLADESSPDFNNTWAIDNVLIVNKGDKPTLLADDFDAIDPSNWLFFPGGNIRQKCRSEENSMYFNDLNQTINLIVSRDLDLSVSDIVVDLMLEEQFESKYQPGWEITGGRVDVICGKLYQANSMVFDGAGQRKACTPYMDTRAAGNLRFFFGFGSGTCHSSRNDQSTVSLYVEDRHNNTQLLRVFTYLGFTESKMISIPINGLQRRSWARICWYQRNHGGLERDVWAIDGVQVLPHFPHRSKVNMMMQFDLNLQCGNDLQPNSVNLEVSTDYGQNWYPLHEPCLLGNCYEGKYQPVSSHYDSSDYRSWKRVTTPLPYVALVPSVRFRWQKEPRGTPNWAIDNVYIGKCQDGCNGHGQCTKTGCRCDFEYRGVACQTPVVAPLVTMVENFADETVLRSTNVVNIRGASLSYSCGVLSSGKALVFDKDGPRRIVTVEFNTTQNRYLQFYIRIGSNSVTSKCPPPSHYLESVILDYSCNGGLTWELIKVFGELREPQSDIVMLPVEAKKSACRFRWWQPSHSGFHKDMWAIDGISINNYLFNTLYMDMRNYRNDTHLVAANLGRISNSYCDGRTSMSFIDPPEVGEMRYLLTRSLHAGPTYIIQFDLVMGCRLMYDMTLDNLLYLEYSLDHGLSWALVEEPCEPPKTCKRYTEGTVYHPSRFTKWSQVTVPMPPPTWGHAVTIRLRQSHWGVTDSWAVSRIYIGQQCPNLCNGHGQCMEGLCQCDSGFNGEDCHPNRAMDSKMQADFGIRYEPDTDFINIWGGEVTNGDKGCGTLLSGETLYFSQDGVREAQTKDLNTVQSDYIEFFLRIGGGLSDCDGGERMSEGVLLQYSVNGGSTWELLQEMLPEKYRTPKFVHVVLPKEAKSPLTRFRWWQPTHSGGGKDQWALDQIRVGHYERLRKINDDFNTQLNVMDNEDWSTITEGILGKYCQNRDRALILANQQNNKFVITKDMKLQPGDVIQFRINVGCSNQFRWDHPVMLQYSHNGGQNWHLLHEPCYQENDCDGHHTEGTIFYSGPHGYWQTVIIPVSQQLAMHPVMLRWWQQGGYAFSFGLDDVYIGPPCPQSCHRNGVCQRGRCRCDNGYNGPDCGFVGDAPYGMSDWFDNHHKPGPMWRRTMGGKLGLGCGVVDYGNSLYFSDEGTREAVTVPLNTTFLRMLQFVVKIGGDTFASSCLKPISRNEGVIVDFSTDNEVTWKVLKVVEPRINNVSTEYVTLELPEEAKTESTIFRWWQPLGYGGMPRAEFGLDSVIIGVNETNRDSFQDDFAAMTPDPFKWLQTESAVPRITCNSRGNALEFSRDKGLRFAETLDFHITPSSFLQFDIAMACDSLYGTLYGVMLEYSVDMGQTWHPVIDHCAPPDFQCSGYHLSSEYMSDQHKNWTRVTMYLPPGAVSPATRIRWKQRNTTPRGNVWALDNVYLGNGCPWLCSGHGYCRKGRCICDRGYGGPHCEPQSPLPMMLRDTFNSDDLSREKWKEVYGGEPSSACGKIVSGNSLLFHKDHLRMIVSQDIDTTMIESVEFYFKYGCKDKEVDWPRSESVLLQYSRNGGIIWNLIKEIHFTEHTGVRFFSLDIPNKAKSKATRFRFWQPENKGNMRSTWSIDNLYIGRGLINNRSMSDNFESSSLSQSWLFINDGIVAQYCQHNTRQDTVGSGRSALVFRHSQNSGEHYVETKDLDVGPMSILQFDINVGCEAEPMDKYPIKLEYSANGGKTWQLLVPNCAEVSSARCFDVTLPSTLFYGGTTKFWRRITVPLDNVYICGSLRFRWYQGFIANNEFAPEWAIDNIFIGMACMDHCLGHGACSESMMCTCDQHYHGDVCYPATSHPAYLKEEFNRPQRSDVSFHENDVNKTRWWIYSGGEVSGGCGELISGEALHFRKEGERELTSHDLDLSKVSTVQFFIRLGCHRREPDITAFPVYLQYSTNAGITWHSIEQFDFNKQSNTPKYIALHLPEGARRNSTRIRWWQPSLNGTFPAEWAIDQIFIGGDVNGAPALLDNQDLPRETSWLVYPGAQIESVCRSPQKAIHFNGDTGIRYAMSGDVIVTEGTFLQFDVAMGCVPNRECYNIRVEFSHDLGNSWELLQPPCLPSDVDCGRFYPGSTLMSDIHTGWNRVTIPLPYYSRAKTTRFRWIQPSGYGKKQGWAVSHLYIGKNCAKMCSGHGKCSERGCICDSGWEGLNCSIASSPLPTYLYVTFESGINESVWSKVAGAEVDPPCKVMAARNALHFFGGCSRLLITTDLNLENAVFIQFLFLFGCNASPVTRNQGVLLDYSTDGGITWMPISELYYALYKTPRFFSILLPQGARKNGVRFRWWQPQHGGRQVGDWSIDNIRIGGSRTNSQKLVSKFDTEFDHEEWLRTDHMNDQSQFCSSADVAMGTTTSTEDSVLTTRDLNVQENDMIQFELNVGCGQSYNASVAPVHLQFSTNHGVSWSYLNPQCLPKDSSCNGGPHMASIYFGEYLGKWRRHVFRLSGLPVSRSTRFRWVQKADGTEGATHSWGIRNVYIGPACDGHCTGHGLCRYPQCICDPGFSSSDCGSVYQKQKMLKDNFEKPSIDKSKWMLVEGGEIGKSCQDLVEGSALVMSGPNYRQLMTVDLDLRNTRFVQYVATIGGEQGGTLCFLPTSLEHSVIVQYTTDGGISWNDLHILDFSSYINPKRDYIVLPQSARTESTRIRWWQPLDYNGNQRGPQWAIDNVLIGGSEINPSHMLETFDQSAIQSDAPWEFNSYGEVKDNMCTKGDDALVWEEGKGTRSFTTNQMIVQDNYMLQFKIVVGCDRAYNTCLTFPAIHLEYNKNPRNDKWDLVQTLCLPDNNHIRDCQPSHYHSPSIYSPDAFRKWTRITIPLPEKIYSSTTRFRWIQNAKLSPGPSWSLDDIYVGENCPSLCHSRGMCRNGNCFCDKGYYGKSCKPTRGSLIKKMYDSFEGGIFKFYWESILGGGIGFGCGALRPYAHGKTLYFNGCGVREAKTVEIDLKKARKLMFVLQIGCREQTSTCNVQTNGNSTYRGVLLQYTTNRGAEWKLLSRHDPEDYLSPKRAAYNLPSSARLAGVQFRWWQPTHGGRGYDQWAIDQVEIIQDHSVHSSRHGSIRTL